MWAWFFFLLFPSAVFVGVLVWALYQQFAIGIGTMILALVIAVTQGCGYRQALHNSIETRTFTVGKVERGTDDKPDLVYTDVGVFSVQDSFWLWKFDTSDRYSKIQSGKTYTCKAAGWRIRFLSEWENIFDCQEILKLK